MKSSFRFLCLVASLVATAHASRTGLNNIPTADTSASGTGVVQAYSTFGPDRDPVWLAGVRVGLLPGGERVEVGVDTRRTSATSVPVFFNAKWASHWKTSFPSLGLGVASLALRAAERRRLGPPQTYAVVSYPTRYVRIHAGYALQAANDACFFGVDRSWTLLDRKLTFRSDALQIQNRAQWLASVGFTYKCTSSLTLELWQNIPTERGKSYTTAKLGWGFAF